MQPPSWTEQARRHWREYRPKTFRKLQASGQLETRLREAAEATSLQMLELMAQGFQHHEAWEATREQFLFLRIPLSTISLECCPPSAWNGVHHRVEYALFLPEEPGTSDEAPASQRYLVMNELNDAMKYLGMMDEEIAAAKQDGKTQPELALHAWRTGQSVPMNLLV